MQFSVEHETTGDASPKVGPIAGRGAAAVDPELHRTLLDVLRAVASHRDLPTLLRELFDVLQRVVPFARVTLVLHDPGPDVMRLHTLAGPAVPYVVELPVAESPAGIAWQTQRPLVLENIDRDTRFPTATEILRADGIKSHCAVPLTSPLRRLGALSFSSRNENAFSDADVDFLQQLTSQIALAVDNTLHHEQLASERDRLQLLLEVSNALVSNLDKHALFSAIASCLRRVLPHDYTSVAVYDAERDGFDMRALEFMGKGLIKDNMFVPVEGSPAGVAFTAREPRRFERAELAVLRSEIAGLLLAEGIQAMCSVPLAVRDRRVGTLCIGRLSGEPFSVADAELLATVAQQVAFSVDNALAFEEIAELKDKLAAEKVYLEDEIRTEYNFEEIIGQSSALRRVLHQVETVAPTDSAVLIGGETGTGKELIARAIHQLSRRRERTFVKLNCAAIPTGLLESELFGHERGAFTGAIAQRVGRFELADRGTLFLDEVGDIPLELQPKLLRVLQEKEFERLGEHAHEASRRAGHRRDEPQPRGDGCGGDLPERPLLPIERLPGHDPAVAGAPRGHPATRPPLRAEVREPDEQADRDGPRGRHGRTVALRLARQCPRARERDRAGRHPDDRARPPRPRIRIPLRGCLAARRQ